MIAAGEAQIQGSDTRGWVWQLLIGVLLIGAVTWWLLLPAANATIGISARTGSLTVEVLCGERLVWDLPPGRIGPRSALPGAGPAPVGNVTLVLTAGARALLVSTGPGILYVSVERADVVARNCEIGATPSFQAVLDGTPLADDPFGFTYAATLPETGQSSRVLSLPISGRIHVGQAVQQGAGWGANASGLLQSGTVTLRVVPAFSDERVTLSTEHVDEGSLLDTHACLDGTANRANACPLHDAEPAHGFLRTTPSGGLSAQIYARGPVGVQAYSGAEQHLMTIPNSTAAWRSEALKIVVALLALLIGLWKHMTDFGNFLLRKMSGSLGQPARGLRHSVEDMAGEAGHEFTAHTATEVVLDGDPKRERDSGAPRTNVAVVLLLGAMALAVVSTHVLAEPVEIRQGTYTGAGYSFRRGTACLVVTARHVVSEIGVPVSVLDRTGAKAEASRSYDNESYDLALVTLRDSPPSVACTSTWPDVGWLQRASLSAASEFQVVRHYPGGKETIVRLKYAGGTKDRLTLAPVDKLNIRESDSGSIVMLDGRPAGIVQSIDTATDRINVLRFDVIDQLVGDRFRSTAKQSPVQVDGIFQRGRPNANWSAFLRAWVSESAGRPIVAPQDPAGRCKIAVDVLEWRSTQVPNPEYGAASQQDCTLMKLLGKTALATCQEQKRNAVRAAPRLLPGYTMTLEIKMTPRSGSPVTKLASGTVTNEGGQRARTADVEFNAMQAVMAPAALELLESGVCD